MEKAEQDVTRLKTGIQSVTENISQIRTQISEMEALMKRRELERQSVTQGISTAQRQLDDISERVGSGEDRLAETNDAYNDKNAKCGGL